MFSIRHSNLPATMLANFQEIEKRYQNSEPIIAHTSGSTGKPSEIILPHTLLKASAQMTNNYFGLDTNSLSLICLSPETIAAKMMLIRAIEGNYTVQINQPKSCPDLDLFDRIDFIALVPLQLKECLDKQLNKLKEIPNILIGGGPISTELENQLIENRIAVRHSYGMTETASHVAIRKAGYEGEEHYRALSDVTFNLQNDCLTISSANLGINHLVTNDIVELISNTTFIWQGRKDFVINTGGYKLHPELLEKKWSEILKMEFFIYKEVDQKWGEIIVLYLESNEKPTWDKEKLSASFKKHEIPKKIYLVDQFIRSQSGKVLRNETSQSPKKNLVEKIL